MSKPYIIGLDIGTTSVGWAVVSEETNKLIRRGNKSLWGVRLFEEATTAENRRNFRSTRRRLDRRRQRIKLLRNEFGEEINKVDVQFYKKLDESFFNKNDLNNKTIKISNEEKKLIREYNKQYPTIYHLRERLINNKTKEDIRLVYFAIHHIIKYRGNFLYANDSFNINNLNIKEKMKECLISISKYCDELEFSEEYVDIIDYNALEIALLLPSKNDRKVELQEILNSFFPKNALEELKKLLVGNQFSIAKLFNIELEKDKKLALSDADFDDKVSEIELNDEKIEIINQFKELYDMVFLKNLFKNSDNTSISALMIKKYNNHQEDLRYLKDVFNYDRKIYRQIFRTNSSYTCLYDQYIHNKISFDDFKKNIEKYLNEMWDKVEAQDLKDKYEISIKQKLNSGTFLPRITETDNGRFPYQLNKEELRQIIENQGKYYPFLLEKVNNTYKLIKILEFKIPYYVGPLNNHSEFAWIKKNSQEAITPYNFDEVIDKDSSAVEFIERMLGHCTYLLRESAMASNSIICSEYKVLNELKQIRVNGTKLTNDFQYRIIEGLFKTTKETITDKKFKEYLLSSGEFDMYKGNIEVKGYSADGKFANNMNSYIDFFGPNGFFKNTEYNLENAEEIIRWITIFEDKDILISKLKKEYPLLENKTQEIAKKKYKGWSSLSKRLLTEKYYLDKKTNVKKSILDLMYETDENFMQIINNKEYDFDTMINNINNESIKNINKISYEIIDELATSPANKRGIWQSILVVEEIVKYMGYEPSKISLEMSRGEEKKERKPDRKKYLQIIYEKCKNEIEEYLKDELNHKEKIDSEKLFLYFIQEGKCLYTGERLNVEDLSIYEVDHIVPRSIIKDDSIDNKALVTKKANQDKAANLILPEEYRKNKLWWDKLKRNNLISTKKYHNLIRQEYSKEDIEGFINRQLVETRQITKHVANIFKNYHKNSKIIYLPAKLSHNYREKFELFKYRDLNDYHHAHDAYLAAVLGLYKDRFKYDIDSEQLKELSKTLYEEQRYHEMKYGFVINSLDDKFISYNEKTGEVKNNNSALNKIISDTLYQNDIIVSKKTDIKTGEFYNQTKNSKGEKGVPLKKNLAIKYYGSYTSLNPAYAALIEYTRKGKKEKRLIGVPIYVCEMSKTTSDAFSEYMKSLLKLKDNDTFEVICNKIPFYALIDWNGAICSLVGATDTVEVCNAKEFKIDKLNLIKWKYSLNRLFNKKNKIDDFNYNSQLTEIIKYVIAKIESEYKLYNNLISQLNEIFNEHMIEDMAIENKEKSLIELFNLLKFNSKTANFKFINPSLSGAFGKKHGRIIQNAVVINQSVTGLWSRKYEF